MNRRYKLCHLQLLPINSGVQKLSTLVLKELQAEFVPTLVVGGDGPLVRLNERNGVAVRKVPGLVREISLGKDLIALFQLYSLFKQEDFDLVHTHSSKTGFLGRLAARMAGVPVIIHHVHGFPFHDHLSHARRWLYICLEYFASFLAQRVIFVNQEERRWAEQYLGLRGRAVTIYNGVQIDNSQVIGQRSRRKKVVAFVGRLWEQKDPRTMIATFIHLARQGRHCWIIGDGPYRFYVKQEIDRVGLGEWIRFWGWQEDMSRLWPLIDVLFLPSLWEGAPFTILEAMAHGIPVVATDIKGNRELVKDGQTGFLFPPGRVYLFAQVINSLLQDDDLRNRLGFQARQRVQRKFDQEEMIARIRNLYLESLARADKG